MCSNGGVGCCNSAIGVGGVFDGDGGIVVVLVVMALVVMMMLRRECPGVSGSKISCLKC